jgi:hypothetical protein
MLGPDGRIAARKIRLGDRQDHTFLPGAVLVALASRTELLVAVPAEVWDRALRWQRNRFHVLRSWGMVGWQTQGWSAVHRDSGATQQRDFVFELADWALERQLETTGAFLEDLSPEEPSFNTGFIAEGIAAAWSVAVRVGDAERAARYERSWRSATAFMQQLMIRPLDGFALADPDAAMGGVRLTPSRSDVRADSVSHWLNALVTGTALLSRRETT